MSSFIIEGGHSLQGTIIPQGAKNEALQILCAVLLTQEEVIIENIPNILDVNNLIALLADMGVKVKKLGVDTYSFKAENIDLDFVHSEEFIKKAAALRGSIMTIGPMLARFGHACVPKPGGDKIGRRRLDTHFNGIMKLGAKLIFNEEKQLFSLAADQLKGQYILLEEASVTGTANFNHIGQHTMSSARKRCYTFYN
jgi:UDP-N-acetylglucosamine 1-carboxyvinyltransferase